MKNILFVYGFPINPLSGGVERITHLLAVELLAKCYEVIFLSLKHEIVDNTVTYIAPQYFFPTEDVYSEDNIVFYNSFIQEHRIDVIINQQCPGNASYLFLNIDNNYRKKVKVITVCHNKPLCDINSSYIYSARHIKMSLMENIKFFIKMILFPLRYIVKHRNFQRLYKFVLEHSDKFIVFTEAYAKEVGEIINLNINKIVVIPNPNTYSSVCKNHFDKQKQILYVGRLTANQKRPDSLLKIWRKIYKKYPDWNLIFCGSGEMETLMKLYVKRHKLRNVTFCGNVDPLPYYQQASILVMTSVFEGFPMVLTEAMKNECIPIAFDSFAAIKDVIIHGKTGILVKPFNLSEFSEKLTNLMKDDKLRRYMAKEGAQYVLRFDISNIIEKWINLIEY